MLAGLSVVVLLCGQFEQVYVFEEKNKNLGFALLRVLFSLCISVCLLLLMVQTFDAIFFSL
jgi:type II secretory pathway component PulJ